MTITEIEGDGEVCAGRGGKGNEREGDEVRGRDLGRAHGRRGELIQNLALSKAGRRPPRPSPNKQLGLAVVPPTTCNYLRAQ